MDNAIEAMDVFLSIICIIHVICVVTAFLVLPAYIVVVHYSQETICSTSSLTKIRSLPTSLS